MKKLLRENPLIFASVALPLLVVIFFAAASIIPRLYSSPPAHDLILLNDSREISRKIPFRVDLSVRENRVVMRVVKSEETQTGRLPRLFIYDHLTESVREVNVSIPDNAEKLLAGDEIAIPELEGLKVSADLRAPDGYEFRGRGKGGGLMTGIFGGDQHRSDVTIAKDGAIVRVRLPATDYWSYGVRFLGWVVP
jgi:hypothetical protein